jgi:hypothetical protein
MCDIYYHRCTIAGCPNSVDFHIADFDYPREAFTLWCEEHLYLAPANAVRFEYEYNEDDWGDPEVHELRRCAVLGPEVDEHTNTINGWCRIL